MNLFHLRYFVRLAHLQHYTRAAEELRITQPSLSHAISQLEEELGVALFEKTGRNIAITKYGSQFLESVEKSLDILDKSVHDIRLTGSGSGVIDLGFLRSLGTLYIPPLIKGFLSEFPQRDIQFRLHSGITSSLVAGLKEKRYDLAICSLVEDEPSIHFRPIGRQKLVLAVPLNHPLAPLDCVHLKDTLSYPIIAFSKHSGLRAEVDSTYKKTGRYPDIAYEIEEEQVIAGMVAAGLGIAVMPQMALLDTLPVKTIEILSPTWERMYYLAVRKDCYHAPIIAALRDFIPTFQA